MSARDRRSESEARSEDILDKAPVHIDRKGRLFIRADDLARSSAFRTTLTGMEKLSKTHPPTRGS